MNSKEVIKLFDVYPSEHSHRTYTYMTVAISYNDASHLFTVTAFYPIRDEHGTLSSIHASETNCYNLYDALNHFEILKWESRVDCPFLSCKEYDPKKFSDVICDTYKSAQVQSTLNKNIYEHAYWLCEQDLDDFKRGMIYNAELNDTHAVVTTDDGDSREYPKRRFLLHFTCSFKI